MRVLWAVLISFVFCSQGLADIALMLNESTGAGMSRLTSAGHSGIYLSNVCPESPVQLRMCRPGEQGSVIANYAGFGQSRNYAWNVVPLAAYLHGVDDATKAPLYGNAELRRLLQEDHRRKYLKDVCPDKFCGEETSGHWRDMVGSAFIRDIYFFHVKTTREQDEALVEDFNSIANVNRYNGFTNNCADFAQQLVNRYFPRSARTDHLNDFGMTSPKAISKSFSRYGEKHPELDFHVTKVSQLPGSIRRSSDCRKGTEVGFTSKKWFVPMLLRSHELAYFVAAYVITGRFNPEKQLAKYPTARTMDVRMERLSSRSLENRKRIDETLRAEREAMLGDQKIWAGYKAKFEPFVKSAVAGGLFRNRKELKTYFKQLDAEGKPALDENGAPVLNIRGVTVGLARSNIVAASSDANLAYKLMLARVSAELSVRKKNRNSLPEFESDWKLMTSLQSTLAGEQQAALE